MIIDIGLFSAPLTGSLRALVAILGISYQIVHLDIALLYVLLLDTAFAFSVGIILFLIDFLLISVLMINTIIEVLIV